MKKMLVLGLVVAAVLTVVACKYKKESSKKHHVLEKAGRSADEVIDTVAEKSREGFEKARKSAKEGIQEVKEGYEHVKDKVKDKLD